jgi:hypothetical protein
MKHDETLDADLRALDARLRSALRAPATPLDLVERIDTASALAELPEALAIPVPQGLFGRVYDATVMQLRRRRRPVLARLGPGWSLAAAAAALLAAASAIWIATQPPSQPARVPVAALHQELDQFARDVEQSGLVSSELDTRMLAVAVELDRLALSQVNGPADDLADVAELLADDMFLLELEFDVF